MSRRQFTAPTRAGSEPPDDTGCTVLHVDMDAFYASASLISRPELRGRPVIIGGASGRSVVLSATFATITDSVEPLSLDEAFLDVSGAVRRLGRPTQIAEQLRDTIADEQG